MLEIAVLFADGKKEAFSFQKNSVMIGRGSGNDVCLDLSGVSRYHARLYVDGEDVLVQDLGSTNGTFVNAKKVSELSIGEKDKIAIADAILTVTYQSTNGDATLRKSPTLSGGPDAPLLEDAAEGTVERELPDDVNLEEGVFPSSSEEFYWQSLKSFLFPIWGYLVDDEVSEIMINGPEEIYIESKGELRLVSEKFTEDQLKAAVLNIAQYVGRRVSDQEPYLDARLPDGSRVAILLPPCSKKGISVAIRKFSLEALNVEKLLGFGSLSEEMIEFLRACVILKKNVIVAGGTSSGKTSLLNVVSGLIPEGERIITIEDSAELQLLQEHVLPMETKPPDKKGRGQITIRDLVRASLRMRPDRVIVGEIRGGEAIDLLQAMNTGHSGSMATLHASSPVQALTRLETLALFSGLDIPIRALREQVSSAIDIVIQASRLPDHSRKVTHIAEVGPLDKDGAYQMTDIFRFVRSKTVKGKIQGKHRLTGDAPSFLDEMELAGLGDAIALFQDGKKESK